MEDEKIVALYWERSEEAIAETSRKYGKYCHYIAYNILYSEQDAEECVNDTYIKAWESMPPHRPTRLSAYLGKLTRNTALNRYIHDHAQKRSAHVDGIFHEIEECLSDPASESSLSDEVALKDAINSFLADLPAMHRMLFVRRYWYLSPVKEIAADYGMGESRVKVLLYRIRNKFKAYLEKEGIFL